MLVDPCIDATADGLQSVLEIVGAGPTQLEPGVFRCENFNFNFYIKKNLADEYPDFESKIACNYGICDSPEQFLKLYGDVLRESPRKFCVALTEIVRADQPAHGGWRWHKWGPYVGEHELTCEYLFDESHIERVFVYHIYELR